MTSARLIVCEKTGRWAAALRGELAGQTANIVSVRSLSQCMAALTEAPASFAALETTPANLTAVIEFFAQSARFPQARLAAMITAELIPAELLLREAGAIEVVSTLAQAPRLARLFSRQQRLTPAMAISFQELVAQRMPWTAPASAPA